MIVALLVYLGYIGIDVRKAVEAPVTQSNLTYAKNITIFVWDKYLEKPAKYLWSDIFIKLIWNPSIKRLTSKVEEGQSNPINLIPSP